MFVIYQLELNGKRWPFIYIKMQNKAHQAYLAFWTTQLKWQSRNVFKRNKIMKSVHLLVEQ